jgi:hypothetical protein
MPKEAAAAGAGIAAGFIHGAIVSALVAAKQEKAVPYLVVPVEDGLSAYPNAEGKAYGSYYEFSPHEVFPASGMGEYYELPQAGMGEYYEQLGAHPMDLDQVTQAAAGYGAGAHPMDLDQVTQAAAGYGASPMLTQAAAGYGGNAKLTQAAAGTGEYVSYGASGVGDYEEVATRPMAMTVDEGVYPNLNSAEQALSVAEAAAGVGSMDVPLQSTVDPMVMADPIADEPRGSRAGLFAGGDGIFG